MIKCPSCGGEMQYDPKNQKVKCQYCGSLFDTQELEKNMKESKAQEDTYEGKQYQCTECGATLLNFDDTAITFCSYCGSQAMLEDKMITQNNPDVVIPFQKTKEECIEAYRQKVSQFVFAPSYMKSDTVVDRFRGIYMPYGIYDLKYEGSATSIGQKYSCRRGDYNYYDDYSIVAEDVNTSYHGVSFDLVSKFYDNFSTSIPFLIKDAVPFNPAYLAGYYADCLDVKKEVYDNMAKSIVMPDLQKRFQSHKEYARYGCTAPNIILKTEPKVGMFPVYFLAIRNQKNDAIHYAVVNGQTGKVAIEIPIDFKKYFLLSVIIAMVIFVLLNMSTTLKPTTVLVFSLVASIISFFFSKAQLRRIKEKVEHSTDIGYTSVHRNAPLKGDKPSEMGMNAALKAAAQDKKQKQKEDKKLSRKFLFKEILAILISAIVLCMHMVEDTYYYVAAITALVLVVLSFSDLVKEHNLMVSNKLPQFEKRGGDFSG